MKLNILRITYFIRNILKKLLIMLKIKNELMLKVNICNRYYLYYKNNLE